MTEKNSQRKIIAFVGTIQPLGIATVEKYARKRGEKVRVMFIRDARRKNKTAQLPEGVDIVLDCDFSKPNKIAELLLPYQDRILAMTCRGESGIMKFAQIIPHVPYLRTPTVSSLEWATDKLKMRRRFRLYDPKITPRFTVVKNANKGEIKRIAEVVGFPLVIKPANLASSLLVSICYHEEELDQIVRKTFRKIKTLYNENNRIEEPTILAEEYMDGDMYSIDSYVNAHGVISHCPMVRVITGKNIGHDDFYNYLRITPTRFKRETIERAQKVVETGIRALALKSTTVHAEIMKIDDEWKIIEIGPRMGGFRHILHELSCNIDHSLNDLLIRMGKKPVIPKRCTGYAATLRYYPPKEGVIQKMTGIKTILGLSSFYAVDVKLKVGDRCKFSKNGGKGVFDLTLYHAERSKLLADIRRVEQLVKITVR